MQLGKFCFIQRMSGRITSPITSASISGVANDDTNSNCSSNSLSDSFLSKTITSTSNHQSSLACADDITVKALSSALDTNMGTFRTEHEPNECDLARLIACLRENIMLSRLLGKIGNDTAYQCNTLLCGFCMFNHS